MIARGRLDMRPALPKNDLAYSRLRYSEVTADGALAFAPTRPCPYLDHLRRRQGRHRLTLAPHGPTSPLHLLHVLLMRALAEVARIAAGRVVAGVQDEKRHFAAEIERQGNAM